MESEKGEQSSADEGKSRDCGYRYMMPSYALDEEPDPVTSYRVVVDALLENSSAHGLPTLYVARGLSVFSIALISVMHNNNSSIVDGR